MHVLRNKISCFRHIFLNKNLKIFPVTYCFLVSNTSVKKISILSFHLLLVIQQKPKNFTKMMQTIVSLLLIIIPSKIILFYNFVKFHFLEICSLLHYEITDFDLNRSIIMKLDRSRIGFQLKSSPLALLPVPQV